MKLPERVCDWFTRDEPHSLDGWRNYVVWERGRKTCAVTMRRWFAGQMHSAHKERVSVPRPPIGMDDLDGWGPIQPVLRELRKAVAGRALDAAQARLGEVERVCREVGL